MAGCFGNNAYDRQLERETMRYCDSELDFCPEEIAERIENCMNENKHNKEIRRDIRLLADMAKSTGCCKGCDGCNDEAIREETR